MSDPGIDRIVSDVRMDWVRQGSPARTEEEMMRRAAELAVAKERERCERIAAWYRQHSGCDPNWAEAAFQILNDIRDGKEVESE